LKQLGYLTALDEEIMALAEEAKKEPLTEDLHLGVIPTIGPFLLPRVMPDLWRRYPGLRLYLHEEQTDDLLEKLRRGDIDAALIALPYDIEGLEARVLFEDCFQFACSNAHSLASCGLENQAHPGAFAATIWTRVYRLVAANMGTTLLPELAIEGGLDRVAPLSLSFHLPRRHRDR